MYIFLGSTGTGIGLRGRTPLPPVGGLPLAEDPPPPRGTHVAFRGQASSSLLAAIAENKVYRKISIALREFEKNLATALMFSARIKWTIGREPACGCFDSFRA